MFAHKKENVVKREAKTKLRYRLDIKSARSTQEPKFYARFLITEHFSITFNCFSHRELWDGKLRVVMSLRT